MESLSKLTFKQPPFPLSVRPNNRTSFSTLISSTSFTPRFSRPISLKIRSSSSSPNSYSNSASKSKTLNPFSLLKTPLTIAVAATAIFFSGLVHKPLTASANPLTPPMVQTERGDDDVVGNEESERKLEEVVASNPNDVEALKSLMEAKIKNKKLPEAVEVITRLINLEPEDVEWPLLRCHMYTYMGESEMAKAGFEDIIAKDPLRVEAYHGLVMAVSQLQGEPDGKEVEEVTRRIKEATERCRKEKKIEEMRDFKLLMAQIRVIEGNYDEALKVYEELVKEEPRDFRPYLCQGIIYTLLRKKDEAQKHFDKYKRLVPKGHPYARLFEENMLATKVFSQMGENERMKMGSQN